MLIAIDFDETLTKDAALWREFIASAKNQDHRVICITARRDTLENRGTLKEWMKSHDVSLLTYFTGLQSKVEYAKKTGLRVDIWIDDDPVRCANGH